MLALAGSLCTHSMQHLGLPDLEYSRFKLDKFAVIRIETQVATFTLVGRAAGERHRWTVSTSGLAFTAYDFEMFNHSDGLHMLSDRKCHLADCLYKEADNDTD